MSKGVRIRVAVVLGIAVLAVALPPFINVGRFRLRIADSISRALGRQVTIGSVELRLLPEPGFTLHNFVVADDPTLSAEPMLRAEEVTANLRLSSLWRGRLEIARLSLTYPSLNLVRSPEGKFNLETLLMRASQTPSAPTTASRAQARPRFPYIEADSGRINFKAGVEKKVFSLIDTDFALWSPGEDEWRMRLEGRPFRTDMPVNDTGTLTLEASFRRAAKLSETPVQMRLTLEGAQVGQLTKLLYGRDRGWRGAVHLRAQASGKPSNLALVAEGSVEDFRRFDIFGGDNIRLQTRCTGKLSTVRENLTDVSCLFPLGDGALEMRGDINNLFRADYDLAVTARRVPIAAAVTIAKHSKKGLPEDLSASGTIDAAISFKRTSEEFSANGGGSTESFALMSNVLQKDLSIGRVEFAFQRAALELSGPSRSSRRKSSPAQTATRLDILPFPVQMGGAVPVAASAWIGRDGYVLEARGDADLQRLLQVGRTLGIQSPALAAAGSAKINVKVAGQWQQFVAPEVGGTIKLQDVRAELAGIGVPVLIESGTANLAAGHVSLQNLSADVGSLHLAGTVAFPRSCEKNGKCPVLFDIHANTLDSGQLNMLLNPRTRKRPWYRLLTSREAENSVLASLDASGSISAGTLKVRGLVATKVSAHLDLNQQVAKFTNVRGELFGGVHTGSLQADFSGEKPSYSGSGALTKVMMSHVSAAMKNGWATGSVSGKYDFTASGWSAPELVSSAKGAADFTWKDGTLKYVTLQDGKDSLHFTSYTGKVVLQDATLKFDESKLQTSSGIYEVSGKSSPDLKLEFTLTHSNGQGYKISGSLMNPQVAALPEKQASVPLTQ